MEVDLGKEMIEESVKGLNNYCTEYMRVVTREIQYDCFKCPVIVGYLQRLQSHAAAQIWIGKVTKLE